MSIIPFLHGSLKWWNVISTKKKKSFKYEKGFLNKVSLEHCCSSPRLICALQQNQNRFVHKPGCLFLFSCKNYCFLPLGEMCIQVTAQVGVTEHYSKDSNPAAIHQKLKRQVNPLVLKKKNIYFLSIEGKDSLSRTWLRGHTDKDAHSIKTWGSLNKYWSSN